jgi:hypothetical protein
LLVLFVSQKKRFKVRVEVPEAEIMQVVERPEEERLTDSADEWLA